jgi:type II secretory pathway pseudopilin PulG
MSNKQNKKESGYTLIETMIAVSLFIIIVMVGMGALLNANLLHQKSQNMRSLLDNMSFVVEDMGRNLRTGYGYHCISSGSAESSIGSNTPLSGQNCWGIAFEPAGPLGSSQWAYEIVTQGNSSFIVRSTDNGATWVQMTPDEAIIDTTASYFSILGAEPPSAGDNQQPLVTIHLVGRIIYKNITTPFSLQTSVSQRLIDI